MSKYLVSIDMGGSNIKSIIMKMEKDRAEFLDSILFNSIDKKENEKYILLFLEKNQVTLRDIEKFILVGSGSSYYDNNYLGVKSVKIDEFAAIGIGGTILSKKNEAIVVNIGTGTTIVYSDINNNEYLIGTGLGGGTFYGLSKRMCIKFSNINELFDICNIGNYQNVDLLIGDISKNNISMLSKDITAANFAGYNKQASKNDIVSAILNMITQNIGLIIKLVKEKYCLEYNKDNINIVLTGNFVSNEVVKKSFEFIEGFTNQKYIYVDRKYSAFATAIGAYEYYLIKMREAR